MTRRAQLNHIVDTDALIDQKFDAILDMAIAHADRSLTRDERDRLREQLVDAIDGLIDACREHYRPNVVVS